VSLEARTNGWRGFEGIGEKVEGGWLYRCDGMPSERGCGSEVVISVRYRRVGWKSTGWLVTYGREPRPEFERNARLDTPEHWRDDRDVVLTFCPSCAAVVKEQEQRR